MSEPRQLGTLQQDKADRVIDEQSARREWFLARSRWVYWKTLETELEDLEMEPEDPDTNAVRRQIVREMIRTGHPDFHDYAGEHRAAGEPGPANNDLTYRP